MNELPMIRFDITSFHLYEVILLGSIYYFLKI